MSSWLYNNGVVSELHILLKKTSGWGYHLPVDVTFTTRGCAITVTKGISRM